MQWLTSILQDGDVLAEGPEAESMGAMAYARQIRGGIFELRCGQSRSLKHTEFGAYADDIAVFLMNAAYHTWLESLPKRQA